MPFNVELVDSQTLNVWYIYLPLHPKLPSFVGKFWSSPIQA